MKASQELVDSDDDEKSLQNHEIHESQEHTKSEVEHTYSKLVDNSISEKGSKCSPSLLPPAIVQPLEKVSVRIKTSNNEPEILDVKNV